MCAALLAVAGEQVFEDSPALTAMWQATSSGSTDAFINQLIQNREYAQHRASDGRGPLYWAYEFKTVDTLALLMHLGVDAEMEDVDGKKPAEFFPDGDEMRAEFEADAKAKIEKLAALLAEREEEFFSYQNQAAEGPDDYEDEEGSASSGKTVDAIDYADDEEDEDEDAEGKDEM